MIAHFLTSHSLVQFIRRNVITSQRQIKIFTRTSFLKYCCTSYTCDFICIEMAEVNRYAKTLFIVTLITFPSRLICLFCIVFVPAFATFLVSSILFLPFFRELKWLLITLVCQIFIMDVNKYRLLSPSKYFLKQISFFLY